MLLSLPLLYNPLDPKHIHEALHTAWLLAPIKDKASYRHNLHSLKTWTCVRHKPAVTAERIVSTASSQPNAMQDSALSQTPTHVRLHVTCKADAVCNTRSQRMAVTLLGQATQPPHLLYTSWGNTHLGGPIGVE